jgi:hypothetical protein
MAQLQEKFTEFYKRKYNGRNLQWQPALGQCLVKGHISSTVINDIFYLHMKILI